jgi:hypothetical protein
MHLDVWDYLTILTFFIVAAGALAKGVSEGVGKRTFLSDSSVST